VVRASSSDIDVSQIPLALFGPNDTHATVNVTIIDDNVAEDQEVFQLLLIIAPSVEELGIEKGTPYVADVLIVDDDGKYVYCMCCLPIMSSVKF